MSLFNQAHPSPKLCQTQVSGKLPPPSYAMSKGLHVQRTVLGFLRSWGRSNTPNHEPQKELWSLEARQRRERRQPLSQVVHSPERSKGVRERRAPALGGLGIVEVHAGERPGTTQAPEQAFCAWPWHLTFVLEQQHNTLNEIPPLAVGTAKGQRL
ncbi:hypothetical protein Krac_12136 [Ktedonobacter racemifer DSM 44963]|uniref:Uncharacterized protein n=1 Tax=Ktedonobacter racemifer DSM 44963 TaxID=485913 RepID=D6TFN0_KTERA|nr:hypothetical protein Krac_12136 [Ktedonobacter racemifer DSM 44963]